jgi:hypothetical protein
VPLPYPVGSLKWKSAVNGDRQIMRGRLSFLGKRTLLTFDWRISRTASAAETTLPRSAS